MFHDFSAVEGEWEGILREGPTGGLEFRTVAVIRTGAETGWPVADVAQYFPVNASEPSCTGEWLAREADHPEYQVDERMDECPPGSIVLSYDQDGDTLTYRFTPLDGNAAVAARGRLERSDQ